LNVYSDETPLQIPTPKQLAIRFAGCHMHFAGLLGPETLARTVKAMDAIVGVSMVALLRGLEDERRRHFYGRAGEYREPPHGLEYRVPSSTVLCHPVVTYLCFDLARRARHLGIIRQASGWKASESEVREIVNSCDIDGALAVLRRNKQMLTRVLAEIYGSKSKLAFQLIMNGASSELPIGDMRANWNLEQVTNDVSLRLADWHKRAARAAAAPVAPVVESLATASDSAGTYVYVAPTLATIASVGRRI